MEGEDYDEAQENESCAVDPIPLSSMPVGKDALLAVIHNKRVEFSLDPKSSEPAAQTLMESLELLEISVSGIPDDKITPDYVYGIYQKNPHLNASTLTRALAEKAPVKASRRRNVPITRCERCGGLVSAGTCTDCSHAMREIDVSGGKGRSVEAVSD